MRIRTVKPGFFKDDELAQLAPLTRLLFQGLWCLADCEGRLEDRPARIKVEVLPYDTCDVDEMLGALHEAGFIVRYAVGGKRYLEVRSFTKHQRISGKEALTKSEIPPATPSEAAGKHPGKTGEALEPDQLPGKGREGKGIPPYPPSRGAESEDPPTRTRRRNGTALVGSRPPNPEPVDQALLEELRRRVDQERENELAEKRRLRGVPPAGGVS